MAETNPKKRRRARRVTPGPNTGRGGHGNVYAFDEYSRKAAAPVLAEKPGPAGKKTAVRRKRKKNQMRVISAFVFLLFIVYLCLYIGTTMSKEQLSETKIIMGSIETPQAYTGIIVRDERTYKSVAGGVSVFHVADGDRVKKGAVVCGIQDAEAVAQLENDLLVIEENIIKMQENRMDYSIYQSDIRDLNDQIKKIVDNEAYISAIADVGQTYTLKEQIAQKLSLRNKMLLSENKGSLVDLVQNRQQTENQIGNAIANIQAEESGIVSYTVDGLEEILTMDSLYSLTKEQTTGRPEPADAADYDEIVAANDPVFKIVRSNNWYIAAYLPVSQTEGWEEGSYKTLYIYNGDDGFTPYEATIDKLTATADEHEVYTVFKCNTLLADYLGERSVSFQTVSGIHEGYKIPNTAIADKTLLKIPKKYVFTVASGKSSGDSQNVLKRTEEADVTVPISITSSDDAFVYVLQDIGLLSFGDMLVNSQDAADTHTISEVKNVKGVYVTNTGVMIFKEIHMDGQMSSNGAYTVIDPAFNTAVKNQDNIISDVKTLDGNQKIY